MPTEKPPDPAREDDESERNKKRRWPWPWPQHHVESYLRKVRAALPDHERAEELGLRGLVWLAVCGGAADRKFAPDMHGRLPMTRPVGNLWGWTRSATLDRLAEFLESFDEAGLREWVEAQVGFPTKSRVVYAPRRPMPDGMRDK